MIETEGGPTSGRVQSAAETPRSYIVETPSGSVQRNRYHLKPLPNLPSDTDQQYDPMPEQSNIIMTRSRTGTEILPPRETLLKGEMWHMLM